MLEGKLFGTSSSIDFDSLLAKYHKWHSTSIGIRIILYMQIRLHGKQNTYDRDTLANLFGEWIFIVRAEWDLKKVLFNLLFALVVNQTFYLSFGFFFRLK